MYDELVKRLREPCQYENCILCQQAADAIEELNKQHEQQRQNLIALMNEKPRWIPVTERLPSNGTNVLVFEYGRVEQAYTTTYTADRSLCWVVINGGSYYRVSDANCPIKWWMPLPQPPKEET